MATKADFIGFTFAGVHSSDLGIMRISGGDRFEEDLVPEIKDIAVEVPGMHGEYFFGSTYGTRTFDISFAFDHLTETQFRKLRGVYGQRQIGQLIFDERPYKQYLAKIESPIELSYVCFDEQKRIASIEPRDGIRVIRDTTVIIDEETQEEIEIPTREYEQIYPYITLDEKERIYKGEGKITFVCYFPFAKSVYKQLPLTEVESDWAISSGILSAEDYADIDVYMELESETYGFKIYNAGDVDTGFRLYIPAAAANNKITLTYKSREGETFSDILEINPVTLKSAVEEDPIDVGYLVDTNNGLLVGVSVAPDAYGNYTTSGVLYNEYVESGYFFKFKPNITKLDGATLQIEGGNEGIEIFYDYLYF